MLNKPTLSLSPGLPYPIGATYTSTGINFALVSLHAHKVELCLFDEDGQIEWQRLALPACDHGVWHGRLNTTGLDTMPIVYGYRVYGDNAPHQGHRFNPAKLLLDPYARDIVGGYQGQDAFHGDDPADTAAIALKARIEATAPSPYDWENDQPPSVPHDQTVLYELHVQGFTRLHPAVPPTLQGSYAALACPVILDYLTDLGITTVSMLPVHYRADEARLQKAGRANYWGYSSIGFFAPERRYWSGTAGTTVVSEFRDMVKALHRRGIEVVLDVVYNHTGETDANGPTLSFRGIDNALYYHLQPGKPGDYENWTGCGNALNLSQPRVLQLVMDSLRYWVQEMHVDGFRFDLAPVLARDAQGFSKHAAFFAALAQDPVLAHVKLIAEPWDIGPGGYQLGNFPARWQEWNDRYRDTMRAFWLRRSTNLGAFAHCLTGSAEPFARAGKLPSSSINFITAHDGFTLADLVSYTHRHNAENGEYNHDGHGENLSINCGIEGTTLNAHILTLRGKLQRALLTTLFFSQGSPMLLAGDEFGNSQGGNNNAYCQDNAVGWLNWPSAEGVHYALVRRLIALRARYAALRHPGWHTERPEPDHDIILTWLTSFGSIMLESDWHGQDCLCVVLQDNLQAQTCLLLCNADVIMHNFRLPAGSWQLVLDSSNEDGQPHALDAVAGSATVPAHCVMMAVLLPSHSISSTPENIGKPL